MIEGVLNWITLILKSIAPKLKFMPWNMYSKKVVWETHIPSILQCTTTLNTFLYYVQLLLVNIHLSNTNEMLYPTPNNHMSGTFAHHLISISLPEMKAKQKWRLIKNLSWRANHKLNVWHISQFLSSRQVSKKHLSCFSQNLDTLHG